MPKNIINQKFYVKKILNNNCMIVEIDGKEKLFLGKGIAFGKKSDQYGTLLEQVEKIFVIEDQQNVNDYQLLISRNDKEFIQFCEELIWKLSQKVHTDLNERIHVGLIDHLSCTLHRLKMGEQILNPFLQETEVLYETEFLLAEEMCSELGKQYQVAIPRGEVGFVALHIHSAMYNGKIQEALKSNRICANVLNCLEEELHVKISRKTLDCSRFMAHLTYLVKRISKCEETENGLTEEIILKFPESFRVSQKVAQILEKEMKVNCISREELAYLTIHIERLSGRVQSKIQN